MPRSHSFPALCLVTACCLIGVGFGVPAIAEETPPIMPNIQETPLPPRIQIEPAGTDELAAGAVAPDHPITAEEAVQIALSNQPAVQQARGGLIAASGRTRQARSALYPKLGLSAGYTHVDPLGGASTGSSGGVVSTGSGASFPGYTASATVRQLIWDFGRTHSVARQARALENAADANIQRVSSDVAFDVKEAFYTFEQNERIVSVNESDVRNRQAQLALAQARLKSGLGLPLDVVRAQTAVSDAILNLTVARSNATSAKISLAMAMGLDPRAPVQTTDTSENSVEMSSLPDLVDRALKQRPELRQTAENLKAAQLSRGAARYASGPSVYATVGTSSRGRDFPPNASNLTVGAVVQWDIFDAGLTSGRVKESQGNIETAEAALKNARQAVVADVSQAYLNYQTAQQRVSTSEAEVANAQESVRLAEGRYKAGVGIFLDVIDAQQSLLRAQTNQVNARSEVDRARAALDRAVGNMGS